MKASVERISPDQGSSIKLIEWISNNDKFFWHQHPEYEIILVKKGKGKRHIGINKGNYKVGEVLFLGPNLPHTGLGYGAEGNHEEVIIQLDENFMGKNFWETPESQLLKPIFQMAKRGITFRGATRKKLKELISTMPILDNFERLIQLLSIFKIMATTDEYVLLNAPESNFDYRGKNEGRLNMIYNFVEKSYLEPINLADVASEMNLTKPSFCRYFKKMTQMTYTDFVNEYRINKACKLLQDDKTVTQACFESGFNNLSHFNKTFKKVKNLNPKDYKTIATPAN